MEKIPKIAVFQDLTGFGRCSLGVALPVLSVLGCQCCPVPTAYLSAHTAYPASDAAVFRDMTGEMASVGEHWRELGLGFDAVYSGFLGSEEQIGVLGTFLAGFRREDTLVLVDPVMGDWGKPYRTYTRGMCARMAELAARADLITPNLTEAALLLGEPYDDAPTERRVREYLEKLSLGGRRSVALTGIPTGAHRVGAACYDRADASVSFADAPEVPERYPGCGDLYAGVLLGCLLRGEALERANERAVTFVRDCAEDTYAAHGERLEGVRFEDKLARLLP